MYQERRETITLISILALLCIQYFSYDFMLLILPLLGIWCLIHINEGIRMRPFFSFIQKISKNSPTYFQFSRINIGTSF